MKVTCRFGNKEVLRRPLQFIDWPLLVCALALAAFGLMMIYSTDFSTGTETARGLWPWQAAFFAFGVVVFFFFATLDYHYFQKAAGALYLLAVALLVLVLVFGREVRGATRWFDLGLFNFQPAEFAKLALVAVWAKYFSVRGGLTRKFRYVLFAAVYAVIPVALVIWQPDLGSASVLAAVWVGLLIISPMPRRYFVYLLVIFLITGAAAWQFFLHDYQRDRLQAFLDPAADPRGSGYNVIQSIVAVGSGGLTGQGLARGLQSQLRFLPERQTDFIFASTVEELGLIGGAALLFLFAFLLWRMIGIFRATADPFGAYFCAGVVCVFFVQAVVNMGMNVGLLPVTGITLPLVSYGGSSLVISFAFLGVVQNIASHTERRG